jgi:hypothetical protein
VWLGRDPLSGRQAQATKRGFTTATDAARARREYLDDLDRGRRTPPAPASLTVNDLLDIYLDGLDADGRLSATVGSGPWSANVVARPVWKPAAPVRLRAAVASRQVRLTWAALASNGSAITDYIIQRAAPGTAWTTVRDGVSTARSHVVTRLTNGTPYRFRVAAKNAVGIGLWSLVVRAVPRAT